MKSSDRKSISPHIGHHEHNVALLELQALEFFRLANVRDSCGKGHKLYRNVFQGSQVIDAMLVKRLATDRDQALSIATRLAQNLNLFQTVTLPSKETLEAHALLLGTNAEQKYVVLDDENALYRFGPGILPLLDKVENILPSLWTETSSSLFQNQKHKQRALKGNPSDKRILEDLFATHNASMHESKCTGSFKPLKFPQGGKSLAKMTKEKKIMASIYKRLKCFHPKDVLASYEALVVELKTVTSKIYTGDHQIVLSTKSSTGEHQATLAGLESLDDIIARIALLPTDDNASVWTEYIMGVVPMPHKDSADNLSKKAKNDAKKVTEEIKRYRFHESERQRQPFQEEIDLSDWAMDLRKNDCHMKGKLPPSPLKGNDDELSLILEREQEREYELYKKYHEWMDVGSKGTLRDDSCADTISDNSSSSSALMEAIERDPFYQLALSMPNESKSKLQRSIKKGAMNQSISSLPELHDYYSDDDSKSYMELTVETEEDFFDDEGSYVEISISDDEEPSVLEETKAPNQKSHTNTRVGSVSESKFCESNNPSAFYNKKDLFPPSRRVSSFQSVRRLAPVQELDLDLEPKRPKRNASVYIEVHSMLEDDDMTQITMEDTYFFSGLSGRSLTSIPEDDCAVCKTSKPHSLLRSSVEDDNGTDKIKKGNRYPVQRRAQRCSIPDTETSHERILEIMNGDLQDNDVTIVWGALEELHILVMTEVRSRAHLQRHGGVMAIINVMNRYLDIEVIQYLCCRILQQFASSNTESKRTINEMDGILLIKQTLEKHGGSPRVTKVAKAALALLSKDF